MTNDYDLGVEIHAVPSRVELGSEWNRVDYASDFDAPPVTVASMQTYHGGNTAQICLRNNDQDGVEMRVEEEQSSDEETSHVSEQVGYLSIEPGQVPFGKGIWISDVGVVTQRQGPDSEWHTVSHRLEGMQFEPIVFAQLLTTNGPHPAHIRLRNVGLGSFEFQIEEWDYLNQHHTGEQIGYAVLTTGVYPLADGGVLEVGTAEVNHDWTDVSFDSRFEGETVVVSQCQTYDGGQAVVTRQRDVSSSGFEVQLQEEEANDDHHLTETVGYAAVAPNAQGEVDFGPTPQW